MTLYTHIWNQAPGGNEYTLKTFLDVQDSACVGRTHGGKNCIMDDLKLGSTSQILSYLFQIGSNNFSLEKCCLILIRLAR